MTSTMTSDDTYDWCSVDCTQHDHPRCTAVLNLAGEHYRCDLALAHHPLAHTSKAAQALWKGDS